jgi:predicted DNA-binding transcriptional regulator AlpA
MLEPNAILSVNAQAKIRLNDTVIRLTDYTGCIILMKTYSTVQVAALLDVTSATLHRWIKEGRVIAPPLVSLGGMHVRLWSEDDLLKLRKHKSENYWKKSSSKKKMKSKSATK